MSVSGLGIHIYKNFELSKSIIYISNELCIIMSLRLIIIKLLIRNLDNFFIYLKQVLNLKKCRA